MSLLGGNQQTQLLVEIVVTTDAAPSLLKTWCTSRSFASMNARLNQSHARGLIYAHEYLRIPGRFIPAETLNRLRPSDVGKLYSLGHSRAMVKKGGGSACANERGLPGNGGIIICTAQVTEESLRSEAWGGPPFLACSPFFPRPMGKVH